MTDTGLDTLVKAAERGERCPGVTVLTSGWLITGTPTSTRGFLDATHVRWVSQLQGRKALASRGRTEAERLAAVNAITHPLLQSIGPYPPTSPAGDVLNMLDARIATSMGPAVEVRAIQVLLATVSAWWATDHRVVESRGGGSIGGAVAFDI